MYLPTIFVHGNNLDKIFTFLSISRVVVFLETLSTSDTKVKAEYNC